MLVELEKYIKEGTAPHELFHAVFDLVNQWRKEEILNLVMERQGVNKVEANEWLADRFSEYFRTGKFDIKAVPEGFTNKIKRFFNKVKEFVNGMWKERRKIKKLFDDMMDNKIETGIERNMINEIINQKGDNPPLNPAKAGKGSGELPPTGKINISSENASQIKKNLLEIKKGIKDLPPEEFIARLKDALTQKQGSNYLTNEQFEDKYVLRLADHSANARRFKEHGQLENNISVVIQLIDDINFKKNRSIDLVELIYDPSKLTTEKKNNIINALVDWIDTGKYTDKSYNFRNVSNKDPETYYQIGDQKSLFDTEPELTKFEQYVKDNNTNVDVLAKTYDPDIVERRSNLQKKGWSDISMNELYEIKNMIDEHIKEKGAEVSKEVPDNITASILMETAQTMAKSNV